MAESVNAPNSKIGSREAMEVRDPTRRVPGSRRQECGRDVSSSYREHWGLHPVHGETFPCPAEMDENWSTVHLDRGACQSVLRPSRSWRLRSSISAACCARRFCIWAASSSRSRRCPSCV